MARLLLTIIQPPYILLVLAYFESLNGFNDPPQHSYMGEPLVDEFGKRAEMDMGWSGWSDWSTCTRTCDGGASHQRRRCSGQLCTGDEIQYRICSIQPCPESTDFRAQQCAAYDSKPYQDKFYEWEPHHDAQEPCALTCRAKGRNLVVQLSPKVHDGTRCREGSLDMCIDGKCKPVGCDLELGSTKKVDACGMCGGDGSSCAKPTFFWEETAVGECSATCGGGTQLVKPVCKNKKTGEEVDERLCDMSKRPESRKRECKADKCPANYEPGEWSACSASCDGGWQERRVPCVEVLANGTSVTVDESRCTSKRKPKTKQPCNTEPCPKWAEFPWSPCSVTCGQGYQTRNVICRDAKGHVNNKTCNPRSKPVSTQTCMTGIPCHKPKPDDQEYATPIVQPYPPSQAQQYTGTHIVSSEPNFVPDSWGQCSVTCGTGVRRRKVECKIFLEFSRTIARLPDKECPGSKPSEMERCVMKPCAMNQMDSSANYIDDTKSKLSYSWKQTGFTPCSASCLGGVRETIIQCIRDRDQTVVSPYLCDISKKPDVITQTCNDQPCPPRWNVSEFSICSKQCGGGLQTRYVHCVHEVTRGGNTLVVPNNVCTQPPPRAQQFCNVIDCLPRWEAGPWTKCSKMCNGGVKTRKLQCQQVLALGQKVDKSPSHCSTGRPITSKECNTHACLENEMPKIYFNKNPEPYRQKEPRRRLSLKVGGKAYLYRGTHLTVKCPVGKFNRSRIRWIKNRVFIGNTGRIRVSRNGALRIRALQEGDSGVYTCVAGRSKANITIEVRDGKLWRNSEEDMTVDRPPNSVETLPTSSGKYNPKSDRPPYGKPKYEDGNWPHRRPWPEIPLPRPPPPKNKQTPPPPQIPIEDKNTIDVNVKEPSPWDKKFPPKSSSSGGSNVDLVSDQNGEKDPSPKLDIQNRELQFDYADKMPNPRVLPHIHQILTNMRHTMKNASVGTRLSTFLIQTMPADNDGLGNESIGDQPSSFVLGKGKAENLEFDWMVTNWTACTCTIGSYRVRLSNCVVRLHNVSKEVDQNLCIDAGMKPPLTKEICGADLCPPHWETGDWSSCSESRCTSWNTAIQRRIVLCRLKDGTIIDPSLCNAKTKPRQRRKCYKDQCRATWRTGEWSPCKAMCGDHGFQTRQLQCVWFGTKKTAGNACRDIRQPELVRSCRGPPCSNK